MDSADDTDRGAAGVRIGELSRRVGVSTHVLRAWETRYGLLQPARTAAAYRLYSPADEQRVRAMLVLRGSGVPAAHAAARVLASEQLTARLQARPQDPPAAAVREPGTHIERLHAAVDAFDGAAAAAALDAARADLATDRWIGEVVLPFLRELGDRWAMGTATVAQEHFASQLIRSRLAPLTSGWGTGSGPMAVLACPPGERHDLSLLAFGVLLGDRGWRVRYFGADTPLAALSSACRTISPDLVVVAAMRPAALTAHQGALRRLSSRHTLALAGPGADEALALAVGGALLPSDVTAAADSAAALWRLAARP